MSTNTTQLSGYGVEGRHWHYRSHGGSEGRFHNRDHHQHQQHNHETCTGFGPEDLPLELLAHIADYVHEYATLCAMMLVSRHLHNGVFLSRRWRIVNDVFADVQDEDERRKIIHSREGVIIHASRLGITRLFRYVGITRVEAYSLCLPLVALHGHLECVRYLMAEFDIKDKVTCRDLLPKRLGVAGCEDAINRNFPSYNDVEHPSTIRQSPFEIACACHDGYPLVKYFHQKCGVSRVTSRAMCNAARGGNLTTLQYLHTAFGQTVDDVRVNSNYSLRWACANGHLQVVQYLHTAFGLMADDARADPNISDDDAIEVKRKNSSSLRHACRNGHLPVVKYLHAAFGLTADDARANDNHCMKAVCKYGHLPVLQYLRTAFGLTADDARASFALLIACQSGHLSVLQYLHTAFELTADDARHLGNFCLQHACRNGDLPALHYLRTAFELTPNDVRARGVLPLREACAWGHLPVVRYLHTAFNLTADDVRATNSSTDWNDSLALACQNDHLSVVQYLHTTFKLTNDDVRATFNLPSPYL